MKRFAYHKVDGDAQAQMGRIRQLATDLCEEIEKCNASREQSLAITNLEQAVMWANKAVSHHHPSSEQLPY